MQVYRVLRGANATDWDLLSHADRRTRSRRPLSLLEAEEWAGISVYDTNVAAREAARTFRLGSFLAMLTIPEH